jgi:hypothetical protein
MKTTIENLKIALSLCEAPVHVVTGESLLNRLDDPDPEHCSRIKPTDHYLFDKRDGMVIGRWDDKNQALAVEGKLQAQRWAEIADKGSL